MTRDPLLALVLAVSSWAAPQPQYSQGLIVVYGNQRLVEANAAWRGYDLSRIPGRCGLSGISPAELGRLAWVSIDGITFSGPCLVVDAVGRIDAYGSIFIRHEIAEVSRATAAALGFAYGAPGYIYFGVCPPDHPMSALPYAPPLALDVPPYDATPSFYPYPPQQPGEPCPGSLVRRIETGY